jgi:dihydrofolate reductase
MAIIGLVAIDRNNAIGRHGGLPWHYAADMKFFRQQTTGHACVMGYKTWASLKKPLPNRLNIVLSRSSEITAQDGVILLRDKLSVLALKPYLACDLLLLAAVKSTALLPDIDKWIVTEIPLAVKDADTFMPENF